MTKNDKIELVKQIVKNEGITAYLIAKNTSVSERSVGMLINGEVKNPRERTVDEILSYLNNSVNHSSDTSIPEVKNISENEPEVFINKNNIKFFIYDDDTYKIEVDMIPFRAYATVDIDCYFDGQYRENEFNKVQFSVDRIAKGVYLGFKIQNDSMNGGGLYDTPSDAEILGREIDRKYWKELHKNDYGFILMTKNAIMHKDITNYNNETGMFTLHSRNPEEDDFEVSINDVYRIFNVIKRTF